MCMLHVRYKNQTDVGEDILKQAYREPFDTCGEEDKYEVPGSNREGTVSREDWED